MAKKRYYMSEGEKMGSAMAPKGQGQFANMFQGSFMKAFPKVAYMTTSAYPDKLRDIDAQISGDVRKAKSIASKTKF